MPKQRQNKMRSVLWFQIVFLYLQKEPQKATAALELQCDQEDGALSSVFNLFL